MELVLATMTVAIEVALSLLWVPVFYQIGIPLFKKQFANTTPIDLDETVVALNRRLNRSAYAATTFRWLNPTSCAFRNTFGWLPQLMSLPLGLRGLIQNTKGHVRVIGYLNWSIPALAVLLGSYAINNRATTTNWIICLGLGAAFGAVLYFVQYSSFQRIVLAVTAQLAREQDRQMQEMQDTKAAS